MMSEADFPLICDEVEETKIYQNLPEFPFKADNTYGSEDGRFIFVLRLDSIFMLEVKTGNTWTYTNDKAKVIWGFCFTSENHGILCYSPLEFNHFSISKEIYVAKVVLKPDTSYIDILGSSKLVSDIPINHMQGGINRNRFVLMSGFTYSSENKELNFHILHADDINKPPKKLTVNKINDKILFYKLIGRYIYYFDTHHFGLFEDIFFNKSLIQRLDIETGTLTTIETSKFPQCGKYLVYGCNRWVIGGSWSNRTLYLTVTMPYSNPEVHLFFSFNTDTQKWQQIIINTLPSVRQNIIRPTREQNRTYIFDDKASLLINVVDNSRMIILQPRNWEHTEIACFTVNLIKGPKTLQALAKNALLNDKPELITMSQDELKQIKLPHNIFREENANK